MRAVCEDQQVYSIPGKYLYSVRRDRSYSSWKHSSVRGCNVANPIGFLEDPRAIKLGWSDIRQSRSMSLKRGVQLCLARNAAGLHHQKMTSTVVPPSSEGRCGSRVE